MPAKKNKEKESPLSIEEFNGIPFSTDGSTKIISATGAKKDVAVISIATWQGKTSLDLRRYYTRGDEGDPDASWMPGKGIRIDALSALDFLEAITKNRERLADELHVALGTTKGK